MDGSGLPLNCILGSVFTLLCGFSVVWHTLAAGALGRALVFRDGIYKREAMIDDCCF